ncbi:hypothetical protein VKT23_004032 [Stygiomarasmius scandens]|uniref:Uncharacterized protein n=1 Tax=Marasmiellus scandens TaxID=2682957 RepID=A0ABR1JXJ9_9AGAR
MKSFFLRRQDSQAGHSNKQSASKEPSWTTSEHRTGRPDKRDDASRSHKKLRSSSRAPLSAQATSASPTVPDPLQKYASPSNRNIVSSSAAPSTSASRPVVPPPSTRINPVKLPPSYDAPQPRTSRPSTETRKVSASAYPASTSKQTPSTVPTNVSTPMHQVWHPPQPSASTSTRPREEKDGDRVRMREREHRSRDRERENGKDRERERKRDKEKGREKEKDRGKERDSDREKERARYREREREKDSDGERQRQKERERVRPDRNAERTDLTAKERLQLNELELEQGRLKTQELLKAREKQLRDKTAGTKDQDVRWDRSKDRARNLSDREDIDTTLPRYGRRDSERPHEVIRDYAPPQKSTGRDSSDEGDSSDASRHKHGLSHRRNRAKEVIPPISSAPVVPPMFSIMPASIPNPSQLIDTQSPQPLPVHLPLKLQEAKPEVPSSQTLTTNGGPDHKFWRYNYRDQESGPSQNQPQRKLIPDESKAAKSQPLQSSRDLPAVSSTKGDHSQNPVISTIDPNYRAASRADFRRAEATSAPKPSTAPIPNSAQDLSSSLRDRSAGGNSTLPAADRFVNRADLRRGEPVSNLNYSTVPQLTTNSQDVPFVPSASNVHDRKASGGLGQVPMNSTTLDSTYRSASRADFRRGDTTSSSRPPVSQPASATQDISSSLLFAPMSRERSANGVTQNGLPPQAADTNYRSASRVDARRGETTLDTKSSLPQSSSQEVSSVLPQTISQDRSTSNNTIQNNPAPATVDPVYRSASRAGFRRGETTKAAAPQPVNGIQDSLLFAPVPQEKATNTTVPSSTDPSNRSATRADFRRGESSSALKDLTPQAASGTQTTSAPLIFAPMPHDRNTSSNTGQNATAIDPTYRSASRADFRRGEKSSTTKPSATIQYQSGNEPSTAVTKLSTATYDLPSKAAATQQPSPSENIPTTSNSQKLRVENEPKTRSHLDNSPKQSKKEEKNSPVSNAVPPSKPHISPSWSNRAPESTPQQNYNIHVTPPTPVKRTPSGDHTGQPLTSSLRYNIDNPMTGLKNAAAVEPIQAKRLDGSNENTRPLAPSNEGVARQGFQSSVQPPSEYLQESPAQQGNPSKVSHSVAQYEARTSPHDPVKSMTDPTALNAGVNFPTRDDRGTVNYSTGTPKQSSPHFNVSLTSNRRGRVVSISASNEGSPSYQAVPEMTTASNNPSPRRMSENVRSSPSVRPPAITGRSLSTDSGTAALARPELNHSSVPQNTSASGHSPESRKLEQDSRYPQPGHAGISTNTAYPAAPSHTTQFSANPSTTQQQPGQKSYGTSTASTQAYSNMPQHVGQATNEMANPKSYNFSSASSQAYPQHLGQTTSGATAIRTGFSSASAQAYPSVQQQSGQVMGGGAPAVRAGFSSASAQVYPTMYPGPNNNIMDTRSHPSVSASVPIHIPNTYQQPADSAVAFAKPQTVASQAIPMASAGKNVADPSRDRLYRNSTVPATIAPPFRHPKLAELLSDEPQRPSPLSQTDSSSEYPSGQPGASHPVMQQSFGQLGAQPPPVSRSTPVTARMQNASVDSQFPGESSRADAVPSSSRYSPPKYDSFIPHTISSSSRKPQYDTSQRDQNAVNSTLRATSDPRPIQSSSVPTGLATHPNFQRSTSGSNAYETSGLPYQTAPVQQAPERPPSARPIDYSYRQAESQMTPTAAMSSVNSRTRTGVQSGSSRANVFSTNPHSYSQQSALASHSKETSLPSYLQQPNSQSDTPSSSNSQSLQNGFLVGHSSREPSLDTHQTSSPYTSASKPNGSQSSIPVSLASQQESRKKGLFGIFRSRTHSQESQYETRNPTITKPPPLAVAPTNLEVPLKGGFPQPADRERRRVPSKGRVPPPINVPLPQSSVPNGRKSPNKVFTPFRYLSVKRNRTVSAASVEAVNGTAANTVVGSPTASMHSSQPPIQPPPLRDPHAATQEWQQRRYETEHRNGSKHRVQRPGVVFDVPQEPSEDKQNLKYVKSRLRSSRS